MSTVKTVVPIPVYECKVVYIVTDTIQKQYRQICNRVGIPCDDAEIYGCMIRGDKMGTYYVLLREQGLNYNTVGHELRHLVDYILADRSFDLLDFENSAYLSGFVLQTFMKFVADKNIKIK